ncbi:MAG: hypothetical protein ACC652_13425, partial [Acidimicrobiales bacterium]
MSDHIGESAGATPLGLQDDYYFVVLVSSGVRYRNDVFAAAGLVNLDCEAFHLLTDAMPRSIVDRASRHGVGYISASAFGCQFVCLGDCLFPLFTGPDETKLTFLLDELTAGLIYRFVLIG